MHHHVNGYKLPWENLGRKTTIKEMLQFWTLLLIVSFSEKKYCIELYWLSFKLFE